MDIRQFDALMILIVESVIKEIVARTGMNELDAARSFYASEVYSMLEQEESKLWHLSAKALYSLYDEEITTGKVTYPEEM